MKIFRAKVVSETTISFWDEQAGVGPLRLHVSGWFLDIILGNPDRPREAFSDMVACLLVRIICNGHWIGPDWFIVHCFDGFRFPRNYRDLRCQRDFQ